MPEPVRLYLTGPAGSGKSEVARHLVERHGLYCISLADFCRQEGLRLSWPEDRRHLQAAGDRLRGTDAATLARLALETPVPTAAAGVVVVGVRLPEEAHALRWAGYLGVGVTATEWTRAHRIWIRGETWPVPARPTEWESAQVRIDYVLPNEGYDLPLLSVRVGRLLRWARAHGTDSTMHDW